MYASYMTELDGLSFSFFLFFAKERERKGKKRVACS